MKQKFLICKHCGNIAAIIRDKGVPVYCCGEQMQQLNPGTTEASGEKHIPVYRIEGNTVHVTVGSTEHPMTREHYIEWVCLETEHGIQYAHLDPDDEPRAKFAICDGDEVRSVYAFCNQHNLWRK
ncbi:MAG: desulfoferrodoxin [Oscillospiraceae bacterium]|nr:desulfoferrodoxin [Oscillospiraceae bacterium]